MGDPRKQRKRYEKPRFPWINKDIELKLLGEYGLRNKRELRRHYYTLSKIRTRARKLLATSKEQRSKLEKELLNKLTSLKIIPVNATLDDVFDLSIEHILDRRLQTVLLKRNLCKTPHQARQLIIHGHISIKGKRVTSPGYVVKLDEEQYLNYTSTSPFAKDASSIQGKISTSAIE